MKIYKKKELPRHEEEEFSVIVLTCDEHGETNLGFYNFDTEDWSFLSEADQVIETLNLYGYTHQPIR